MPSRSQTTHQQTTSSRYTMQQVPFSEINEPGVYIDQNTGNLLRVPDEAIARGHSPLIEIVSNTGSMVTKLNDDPWLPISKVRQLAADADLAIDF